MILQLVPPPLTARRVASPRPDTTRNPRAGEVDGKDYYFVSHDKFKELITQGAFIEHAQFSGNFYGTSFMTVREIQKSGRRCLLDIEAQVSHLDSSMLPLFPSVQTPVPGRPPD